MIISATIPMPASSRRRLRTLLGTETNGADVLSRMIHSMPDRAVGGADFHGYFGRHRHRARRGDGLFRRRDRTSSGMRLIEIVRSDSAAVSDHRVRRIFRPQYLHDHGDHRPDRVDRRSALYPGRISAVCESRISCRRPLPADCRCIRFYFGIFCPTASRRFWSRAAFGIASAILYESTLSFLGLGVVDEPSWGQLLNQARSAGGTFTWWIALFPGLAIFLTVFSYNLIGEAMRDALDPRVAEKGMM